jgi:pimeloyl-ACP methyl ester carboxylesterase
VVEAMTSKFTSDVRLQAAARVIMEKQKPDAYIGALKAMAERTDSTSSLSTFKFPVVVVHGEADALIPVARAREVKAALPDSYYVELKDTGHVPMLETAKETADALRHLA